MCIFIYLFSSSESNGCLSDQEYSIDVLIIDYFTGAYTTLILHRHVSIKVMNRKAEILSPESKIEKFLAKN